MIAQPDYNHALNELRAWAVQHCADKEAIRHTHYNLSLSAIVHRLITYGPDRGLDHLTARDLMLILVYLRGTYAEWVMRAAFTRALIEGDMEVVEYLVTTPFMSECRLWYDTLVSLLLGTDRSKRDDWINAMGPAPKAIARLILARLYPDQAMLDWIHEVPEIPKLQGALAAVLGMIKPQWAGAIDAYLRERPLARNYLL